MIDRIIELLRRLASVRLTLFGFLLLAVAIAGAYLAEVLPPWTVALPAALLAVNLAAALLVRQRLRSTPGLLVFHVALLLFLGLVAASRMTYLDGRVELAEGSLFDGFLDDHRAGPLNRHGYRGVLFIQGRFEIPFLGDGRRGAIAADVLELDDDGDVRIHTVTEHQPLVRDGYRFTPTANKGFAAVFGWTMDGGDESVGAVHFPGYPANSLRQSASWTPPGADRALWALLDFDYSWLLDDHPGWFDVPPEHRLVLREGEGRYPLMPGDTLRIAGGTLHYMGLRTWIGYRVFHDPAAPWLLAAAVVGCGGLAWHLARREPERGAA